MTVIDLLALLVGVALLGYLFCALMKPEWFS